MDVLSNSKKFRHKFFKYQKNKLEMKRIKEKRVSCHGTIILLIKKTVTWRIFIVLTRYYQLVISQITKIYTYNRYEIYYREFKRIRCTN